MMNRRQFHRISILGLGATAFPGLASCKGIDAGSHLSGSESVPAKEPTNPARGAWFKSARYGLFVSYSVYSLLGQGSWAIFLNQIPVHRYKKLMHRFDPKEFRRDLFGEVAEECHRQGVVINAYYQLRDWTNPAYRESFKPGTPLSKEYVDFVHGQVRELCTQYGKLGALWFDGGADHTPEQWKAEELIGMIRKLQPEALVNDRTGLPGDFSTPEEESGRPPGNSQRLWEHNMTMNDHWGYDASAQRYKSPGYIVQLLVRNVASGGNFLLNVGPEPSGIINPISAANLRAAGQWLKLNGESIYGAGHYQNIYFDNVYTTAKEGKIYYHIFDWKPGHLCDFPFPGVEDAKKIYFLETGEPVKINRTPIGLSIRARNTISRPSPDTVIVIEGAQKMRHSVLFSVPA
jgi:alpha-L-fucosidase